MLARHDPGLDPHDLAAAGVRPVAGAADLAAARERCARSAPRPPCATTSSPSHAPRATRRRSRSACRPAARPCCCRRRKRGRGWRAEPFVTPDEVKAVAKPALRHRIQLRPEVELEGVTADGVLDGILAAGAHVLGDAATERARPTWRLAAVGRASLVVLLLPLPGVGPARRGRRRPAVRRGRSTALLAPAPGGRLGRRATLPGVLAARWRRRGRRGASRNPIGRGAATCGSPTSSRRHCAPTSRRARLRVPAGGRATVATTIRPSRRGRFRPASSWCASKGRSGWSPGRARQPCPAAPRVPPVQVARRSRAAHQPGPHPRGRPAVRAGSRRGHRVRLSCATTRSTTSSAGSTGPRPPAPPRPIVRTYRAERNQTVLLLLDSGRLMAGRVEEVPRLDHAMDAVMMMTAVATRLGDRAGLVAFGRTGARRRAAIGRPRAARSHHRRDVRPRARARGERLPRRVHRGDGTLPAPRPARRDHRADRARHRRDAAACASADRAPPPRPDRRRA